MPIRILLTTLLVLFGASATSAQDAALSDKAFVVKVYTLDKFAIQLSRLAMDASSSEKI